MRRRRARAKPNAAASAAAASDGASGTIRICAPIPATGPGWKESVQHGNERIVA